VAVGVAGAYKRTVTTTVNVAATGNVVTLTSWSETP